jgi:hypothetical protein
MNGTVKSSDWLKSGEVQKELRIDSCELMHLREAGQLKFQKKGNAFLYAKEHVERLTRQKPPFALAYRPR